MKTLFLVLFLASLVLTVGSFGTLFFVKGTAVYYVFAGAVVGVVGILLTAKQL